MKYSNFFLFLLFLIVKEINGASQLSASDLQCLNSLYGLNSIPIPTDYCDDNLCDGERKIIFTLKLTSLNPGYLNSFSNILCITTFTSIELTNFKFDSSVFGMDINEITLINCDLPSSFSQIVTDGTFIINGAKTSAGSQLPLSYITDTSRVEIYGTNINFSVLSDITSAGILRNLKLKSNNVPDLTYLQLDAFDYIYGDNFVDSSNINFKTWSGIKAITLSSPNSVPFPTSLNQIPQTNSIETISSSCPFEPTPALIDLSNLKLVGVKYFTLTNVGLQFSYQPGSVWPFSNLPPGSIFSISGGTFSKVPQLSSFNGVNEVTVQSNTFTDSQGLFTTYDGDAKPTGLVKIINNLELTGSLSDSYCALDILKYSFKDNGLNGLLPQCFSCHLLDLYLNDKLSGNDFGTTTLPCTISPYVRIEPIAGTSNFQIRLMGTNLGFSETYIKSTPDLVWTMSKPSSEFLSQVITSTFDPVAYTASILKVKFVYANNLEYSISLVPTTVPKINSFYPDSALQPSFIISGQYFTNMLSNISVQLDGNVVTVSKTLFDQVVFPTTSFNGTNNHALLIVTVDGTKTTKSFVSLVSGDTNTATCGSTCTATNGICNLNSGICECLYGYTGANCIPLNLPCPNDCSGNGVCNKTTGTCQCNRVYINSDCTGIQCSDPTCSGNGTCNTNVGACSCFLQWTGEKCTYDAISGSSISVNVTETGGVVEIIGYFSNSPDQNLLSVSIGAEQCIVQSVISTKILCLIGPGKGKKSVKIIYNSIVYDKLVFEYASSVKPCLQTCKNGATCDTTKGTCICTTGYSGSDCGALNNGGGTATTSSTTGNDGGTPGSNNNINSTNGGSSINNQQTSYEIFLSNILELDVNGQLVSKYPLKDKWKFVNSTTPIEGANRIVFTQSIKQSILTFTIDEITASPGKDYSFAGIDFLVTTGSLKMQFAISNWTYENNLNSLQLQMESSVEDLQTVENKDECMDENKKDTSIETIESDGTLAYMTISKNNKIFYGRFIDRCLSEGRSTLISSTIVSKSESNVVIGINLPHCKYCTIDPDFSVLVSPDFTTSCDSSSSRKWVLPVAIVVPCVAVAAIVIVTILILKKNRMNIKLKLNKLKSFSMKSFKN